MSTDPRPHVVLGGKRFRVIDFDRRTVLLDHYLMAKTREIGLDKVMPGDAEPDASYLIRLQTVLIDSGKAPELLAGYLLPVRWFERFIPRSLRRRFRIGLSERDWTPERARETAWHVGRCDAREDRNLVIDLSMQVAFGFFRQGLAQLALIQRFSAPGPTAENRASVH